MTFEFADMVPSQASVEPSRIQVMLQSKDRLPVQMRQLFNDMFIENKSTAQITAESGMTEVQVEAATASMIRILKSAVA